jgi:N-acetylglucosamine kinase-like BadF-type ATPase
MILIADSGSTKTTWCFISPENKTEIVSTGGINPYFRTTADIIEELKTGLVPKINGSVENIYFYGAGIVDDKAGKVAKMALEELFPSAKPEIQSDLLAAARSTLQNKKGIACILGTGSNSCLYDGQKIIDHVPPLGFILGDEGGGVTLGKKILADFLRGIMPGDLVEKFRQKFPFQYAEYLRKVYKEERPNKFLASLVPFITENIQNDYCKRLVENSFREFLARNVFQYSGYREQPVCFVGSIAFYFADILKEVMQDEGLNPGLILKGPMAGLIKFHSEK